MNTSDDVLKLQRYLAYLEQDPKNTNLIRDISTLQINLGYFQEAKALLEQTLADNPDASFHFLYAKALHALGDLDQAIEKLELLKRNLPQDDRVLGLLSICYLDNYAPDKARTAAQEALGVHPDNWDAHLVMATLSLEDDNSEAALERFTTLLKAQQDNGRVWSGLGTAQLLRLNLDEALVAFRKTSELLPRFVGNWNAMGWCYLFQQNVHEAKKTFEKAMEVNRNFSENHGALAVIALIENNEATAQYHIRTALKLDPRCFSAQYAEALLLSKKDPKKSEEKNENASARNALIG